MSMLKHVLALFAFIVVSLASVCADEGYIPFFPDFMEPDGIVFRGPASIIGVSCWTSHSDCASHKPGMPFSAGTSVVRSSPITIEYRKNYFFEKLFYLQSVFDFGSVIANRRFVTGKSSRDHQELTTSDINTNPFLQEFLTSEEKSLLSSLEPSRLFDLKTDSSLFILGFGLGLDLWIF